MPRWERTIDIAAPADRVWQVLSDVPRWPDWTDSIETVEGMPASPGVGAEAVVKARGQASARWRVTEWNPGHNFTWVTSVRGTKTIGEHAIEPLDAGHSRVTLAIDARGFAAALFKPLISKGITTNLEMEANGLDFIFGDDFEAIDVRPDA